VKSKSRDILSIMTKGEQQYKKKINALDCKMRKEELKFLIARSCRPEDVDFLCNLVDKV